MLRHSETPRLCRAIPSYVRYNGPSMYVAQPIQWTDHGVIMLDQRRLPGEEISHTYTDYREVARAIREMVIRGTPAIGVAAAMGVALGVLHSSAKSAEELRAEFPQICDVIS